MKDQKVIVRLAFCVIMLGSLGISAKHSQATTFDHDAIQKLTIQNLHH